MKINRHPSRIFFFAAVLFLLLAGAAVTGIAWDRSGEPSIGIWSAAAGDPDELVVVRVYYGDANGLNRLNAYIDPWDINLAEKYAVVGTVRSDLVVLRAMGFRRVEIDRQLTEEFTRPREIDPDQGGGIPGFACYRTVEETHQTAYDLESTYPSLARVVDIGDSWLKIQNASDGYDMLVLVLTNQAVPGPKPKIFIMGALHAREYATAELVTRFGEQLAAGYGDDPNTTWLLDYHEVHLLLIANPDGRKEAETGELWRKNVNNNFCSNTDSRGVDLNRNFPYQWNCCGGSSGSQCAPDYRGPSAGSEPETQAIRDYLFSIFPDQKGPNPGDPAPADATGVFIDVHSYGGDVLYSWGYTAAPPPNVTAMRALVRKIAWFNGYFPDQAIAYGITDGTSDDHAYGELGVAPIFYEIGTWFFQTCASFENTVLPDNMPSLFYAATVARTPYMTPSGPDALNVAVSSAVVDAGEVVELTADLSDTRFNNSNGTEPTQNVAAAEYYVDVPYWITDTTPIPAAMAPADGSFNSENEGVTAMVDTTGWEAGRHILFVRGQDASGNWGVVGAVFLDVNAVPDTGSVLGTVALQGRTDASGVTVEIRQGAVLVDSQVTGPGGSFSFVLPIGAYDIRIEMPGFLDALKTLVSVTAGGSEDAGSVVLPGGDMDEDDEIGDSDLIFIRDRYGQACGDGGFDPLADLNADCLVNVQDLAIAAGNYGSSSPVPWP